MPVAACRLHTNRMSIFCTCASTSIVSDTKHSQIVQLALLMRRNIGTLGMTRAQNKSHAEYDVNLCIPRNRLWASYNMFFFLLLSQSKLFTADIEVMNKISEKTAFPGCSHCRHYFCCYSIRCVCLHVLNALALLYFYFDVCSIQQQILCMYLRTEQKLFRIPIVWL